MVQISSLIKIDLTNTTTHISSEEAFGIYKHFLIDEGDLLIACSGISVTDLMKNCICVLSSHFTTMYEHEHYAF